MDDVDAEVGTARPLITGVDTDDADDDDEEEEEEEKEDEEEAGLVVLLDDDAAVAGHCATISSKGNVGGSPASIASRCPTTITER